jgi:GNAT superfamily N-acetyltransferase
MNTDFSWKPLCRETLPDLETVLGERGGWNGCWCMRWRTSRVIFEAQKGEQNRQTLALQVDAGLAQGVLGYLNSKPVAWCSIGPRVGFIGLLDSGLLSAVDNQPVWSVSCLYITRKFRKKGLSSQILNAAIQYAQEQGAEIIEAYPLANNQGKVPMAAAWTGLEALFLKAGFVEVARRVPMRPIVRRYLDNN